jgi:hypothetical protein
MGKIKGGTAAASKKPKSKPKQRGGVDFKVNHPRPSPEPPLPVGSLPTLTV